MGASAATDVARLGALVVDRGRIEARVDDVALPRTATEIGLLETVRGVGYRLRPARV